MLSKQAARWIGICGSECRDHNLHLRAVATRLAGKRHANIDPPIGRNREEKTRELLRGLSYFQYPTLT